MPQKIFITGIGLISAIGDRATSCLQALKERRSGLGNIRHIQTRHAGQLCVGEVIHNNEALKALAGIPSSINISRTSLLGIIAATDAFRDAGLHEEESLRTGIISATSVGGMGQVENHFLDFISPEGDLTHLDAINRLDCSDSTETIARQLGISGFLSTVSTACSSSANAIMYGARLIRNGLLDRVVVGGTDSLSRFTINGFNTLKILDPSPCKPFDAKRSGLNLGEGAGYLVLESEATVHGKKIYAELSGYGNTNDAYHQTASSPDGAGAVMAMQKSLNMANIRPEAISYINAHGTGTELNDLSEGLAIQRLFGNHIPPVSSTKAFTGHTLAAAGGVEAVLSVLALHHGIIFPNLNFSDRMNELHLIPETEMQTGVPMKHVLSNSFGFGGNTSSLLFSAL